MGGVQYLMVVGAVAMQWVDKKLSGYMYRVVCMYEVSSVTGEDG